MNARLDDQNKKIESTQTDLAQARQDLQNQLGSTRDELNGSISQANDQIARTHEDVVALQRRGERNYYEFDLDKSKQYQRVGPVSLSLRKVNDSHKYYDLALIVDDQRIEKKHVDLFEPLVINVPEHSESIQVVVNSIAKNHVKGYLSEPKYKRADLASNTKPGGGASTQNQPAAPQPADSTQGGKTLQPR
jgi:septal ring factor EnvC (AmiA/AmiB activator)